MANISPQVAEIDLSVLKKKKFRIDKDDNRILELDTGDMNIIVRLRDTYPKLQELAQRFVELGSTSADVDAENIDIDAELINLGNTIEQIDKEMRSLMDYIFDAEVSKVCAPNGCMYDVINGEFRFEHIITTLTALYEQNIDTEYKKMGRRIQKHTDKYTKAKTKK